jgi:hypothetical protein
MDDCAVLRWAAGADESLPAFDGVNDPRLLYLLGIDEHALLNLVQSHHLAVRFASRIEDEHPTWCTPALREGVTRLAQSARDRAVFHLSVLREIVECLPADMVLITLKGLAAVAVTCDDRHIRRSFDLDLITPTPEALEARMLEIGFTSSRNDPSEHEFASLARGEARVEIHRYFPVWSYPAGLPVRRLEPGRNPGLWHQPYTNRVQHAMTFEQLAPYTTHGRLTGTQRMLFPDPHMQALILCAHEFRNYVEPPVRRAIAVKLGVLASIWSLTQDDTFGLDRFHKLAGLARAADSVAFIGSLLQWCYGVDPFSGRRRATGIRRGIRQLVRRGAAPPFPYPRLLTFFGGWANLWNPECLMTPPPLREVHGALLVNEVVAGSGDHVHRYVVDVSNPQASTTPRVIVQSATSASIRFSFFITWSASSLCLTVELTGDRETMETEEYCLDIRGDQVKWQGTQHGEWEENDGTGSIHREPAKCVFVVTFPWEALHHSHHSGAPSDPIPLLLAVARWPCSAGATWTGLIEAADPVVIVPLEVVCEPLAASAGGPR